ncbi:cyclic pyranopterin phosphate synthase [Fontibacillus solani]|uniref:GTP 3',8-cyclase n=1 Tax=Fontibacillus solani TaxID=1572857 RepID=A0A7W3SSS4_9BACL|nr:GTP 3',8-cyclase MoaA [Fontibacillus solani]MBA9085602.1 cyclic pyranopterin phosphate synthase [Fontibacillus solani]
MTTSPIRDQLQRPIRDLRISVTDRCNFRCTYCMPKELFGDDYPFMPKHELLTFEEMSRVARLFASLGVKKIRLTGGEPLLRRDLPELLEKLLRIDGIEDMGLTTNGLLLKQYAQSLFDKGLRRVNVSLDALDPELFGHMNGRGIQPEVILDNIDFAHRLGFKVKVNMVVQKGMNDHEILPMAKYFKDKGITLCFIEFMDVGNDNEWSFNRVVTKKETYERLSAIYDLEPLEEHYFGEVAKRYRYKGTNAEVGFITSVSESFCSTCTRARLSSDGKFYTCLFAAQGFDLRDMIRSGATDEELLQAIASVWEKRSDRYSDERTEQTARNRKKKNMSYMGG